MTTSIIVAKRLDPKKLHKRLAEGGRLRIYRCLRGETRCVICATAIVDIHNRKIHIKENPSLKLRMSDPERTNGTPMVCQWWLQDDQGQLIGPCGGPCGSKAVQNSWLKERRDEIRQQLLAAGVPPAEVEKRLEQIAHQEWLNMLRVYRAAEKEALKLKIDITTMTVDEIVEAVKKVKEERAFKREAEYAQQQGVPVKFRSNGVEVDGILCQTAAGVRECVSAWKEKQNQTRQAQAQARRLQNRQKYAEYVEFIEWALATSDPYTRVHGATGSAPNALSVGTWDRRNLEDGLMWIDGGTPFPKTLQTIEAIASQARNWRSPWTGVCPSNVTRIMPAQPSGPVGAPLPVCPLCGKPLKRKTGTSQRGKSYDFYGCTGYPRCKGSMEVSEYNRQWSRLGQGTAVTVTGPTGPVQPTTISASKALAHLQAQAQALGVKTSVKTSSPISITAEEVDEDLVKQVMKTEEEEEPVPKKKVKKHKGYWS